MAGHRALVAGLLLLTASASGILGPLAEDDAGSGGDAPDAPGEALAVDPGTYRGNLTPALDALRDADWYQALVPSADGSQVDSTGAACTSVRAETSDPARLHLRDPSIGKAHINTTIETSPETLGLVRLASTDPLVGLTELKPVSTTSYSLNLSVLRAADVPSQASEHMPDEAEPVPAPCFGDTIGGDDLADTWTFEVGPTDEEALISLGSQSTREDRLTVRAPNGTTAAVLTSAEGVDAQTIDLDQAGTWTLEADTTETGTTTSSAYIVGLSIDDDPGEENGCRPSCMALG